METANAIVKIDLANGNIVASYSFPAAHDVAIAANGDVYAADYSADAAKIIRLDSNLVYQAGPGYFRTNRRHRKFPSNRPYRRA